ncbi:MAG: hypothetical protein ACYDAY_11735 [Candidatus Dormibacteria bacterium]
MKNIRRKLFLVAGVGGLLSGLAGSAASAIAANTANDLVYGGGAIQATPKLYLVFWGWGGTTSTLSDPNGEAPYLTSFLNGVGGSAWINTQTQYCQGIAIGSTSCPSGATHVGNPSGQLKGSWYDNTDLPPAATGCPVTVCDAAQLQTVATNAAAHFGNLTAASNQGAQYVIATPSGHNPLGFGYYCAYHGSTSGTYGTLSYTNLPYQTDSPTCGSNFVNSGSNGTLDGVSIVEGHEYGESLTDPTPSSGWVDANGQETGDKCAWITSGQGAAQDFTFSTGTFAVQSLWSNAFNGGSGGCVIT